MVNNRKDYSMIRTAIDFAVRKHAGQVRKGNGESYVNHLARVAGRLMIVDPYVYQTIVAAAWLHDTLEDTDTTYDELLGEFGREVADMVQGMTNPSHNDEHKGKSRSVRKKIDRIHIGEQCNNVKLIKLADRIDNLWDFYISGDGFMYKYADESELMLFRISGVNQVLEDQLQDIIDSIRKRLPR